MRRSISTLMRVRSWQLQDKQRRLGEALRAIETIEGEERALTNEIASEQACAQASPDEAGRAYARYAERARDRKRRIEGALDRAAATERDVRAELEDAFGELKRIERFAEGCAQRAAAEHKARDGARLDEIAVGRFVRRARSRDDD